MIEVLNYKDQNPSELNIKFCKMESRGLSYFIPLKINKDKPILIKTPKLYMPFQPKFQTQESGYIRLSFDNFKIDTDVQMFHTWFKKLEKHLHNSLLNNSSSNELKKKTLASVIKESPPYSDYFNINFETNNLKIYNINLKPVPIQDIKGKFYAYFIIQLSGMIYNTKQNNIRIVVDLIQFKLDNPKNAIQECLFLDEVEQTPPEPNLVKNHPKFTSYIKMLNLGIPKFAVQQKMMISGDNPEYLDHLDKDIKNLPENLKKILINIDNIDNIDNVNDIKNNDVDDKNSSTLTKSPKMVGLNSLISSNLLMGGLNKLKKVEKDPDFTLTKIKKMSGLSSILPVPSLNQIKDALQNLKSVNDSENKSDY
jgi:hypothetical protein